MVDLSRKNEVVLARLKQEREMAIEERLNREEKMQEVGCLWLDNFLAVAGHSNDRNAFLVH